MKENLRFFPVFIMLAFLTVSCAEVKTSSAAADSRTAVKPVSASVSAEQLGLNRTPAPRRDFPPAPADGETVALNPCPFVWLKPNGWKPGKFTYTLQYSRNKDFRGDTIEISGLSVHNYLPHKPLKNGTWYWRWGVEMPDGIVWSRSREFLVTEKADVNPYPTREEMLTRIPAHHPRLELNAERLVSLRERAKTGNLRTVAARMKRAAESWKDAPLMKEPPYLPPAKSPQWGPEYRKIMRAARQDTDRMNVYALLYLLTGETGYAQKAKQYVLNFVSWDPAGSTSITANDEPAMSISSNCPLVYDWLWEFFTPEERRTTEKALVARLKDMYSLLRKRPFDAYPFESHNNHCLKTIAQNALLFMPDYPELYEVADYAIRTFYAVDPIYGTPDGGWNEGPAYGSWGVQRRLRLIAMVRDSIGFDMMKKPFYRNCGYYQLIPWRVLTRLPAFSDGYEARSAHTAQANMLRYCAGVTGDPVYLKASEELQNGVQWLLPALLMDPEKLGKPDLSALPSEWLFPGIGLAALRNDLNHYENDVALLMQSNPFGATSHHHNVQNCFMLEAFTEPLLIASGHYDYYGSPHHSQWVQQTRSANGITVDGGQGQLRGGQAAGRLYDFETGKYFSRVTGDASAAYSMLDTVRRTVVHVKPGFYVIHDFCDGKEPHTFEYNLHSGKPGVFDEKAQLLNIEHPKAGIRVLFFADRPWKFHSFDRFPVPPYRHEGAFPEQWHFTASSPEKERQMELTTVLLPYRSGEADKLPEVKRISGGVMFRFADGSTREITFRDGKVQTIHRKAR